MQEAYHPLHRKYMLCWSGGGYSWGGTPARGVPPAWGVPLLGREYLLPGGRWGTLPSAGWGTPHPDLGWGTTPHQLDGIPPCEQSENITFPIPRMQAVITQMVCLQVHYHINPNRLHQGGLQVHTFLDPERVPNALNTLI